MNIRKLEQGDYDRQYLAVLGDLTRVGTVSRELFNKTFAAIQGAGNIHIFVAEERGALLGSGTLVVEQKFIHSCKAVGHIEDIVVRKEYQHRGYGTKIVDFLLNLARKQNCYKVILNCTEELSRFYQHMNLKKKGVELSLYLE